MMLDPFTSPGGPARHTQTANKAYVKKSVRLLDIGPFTKIQVYMISSMYSDPENVVPIHWRYERGQKYRGGVIRGQKYREKRVQSALNALRSSGES